MRNGHDHPDGLQGGSGYDGANGDKQNITDWKAQNPKKTAPFYLVYDKVGDTYYQYTEEKGDIKIGSYEDLIRIINEILSK